MPDTASPFRASAACWLALSCFGIVTYITPAQGQTPVEDVIACRAIADESARFACYETSSARLEQWRTGGQRAPAQPAPPPSASTMTSPPAPAERDAERESNANFGIHETAEERRRSMLQATTSAISVDTMGRIVVGLDNGQVWRATSGARFAGLRPGTQIQIAASGYGGFRLRIVGQSRELNVERIQ